MIQDALSWVFRVRGPRVGAEVVTVSHEGTRSSAAADSDVLAWIHRDRDESRHRLGECICELETTASATAITAAANSDPTFKTGTSAASTTS